MRTGVTYREPELYTSHYCGEKDCFNHSNTGISYTRRALLPGYNTADVALPLPVTTAPWVVTLPRGAHEGVKTLVTVSLTPSSECQNLCSTKFTMKSVPNTGEESARTNWNVQTFADHQKLMTITQKVHYHSETFADVTYLLNSENTQCTWCDWNVTFTKA